MSQRDPLDREEAELAAALRGLPRVAPPEALDQRILQSARDALRPRRKRPWHWAGAAAAALALMVGAPQWRTPQPPAELAPMRSEPPGSSPVVSAEPESANAELAADSAERDSQGFADRGEPSDSALQSAPPPPPAPVAAPASRPPPMGEASRAEAPLARERRQAPPPAPAPAPEPSQKALAEADALARDSASAGAADAASPEQGLEHIARLLERGDEESARRALRELLRQHPGLEVPEALRPLLEDTDR